MNSRAIIVMCKNPVPGLVKTRLAKTVGAKKANDIYKFLLQNLFKQLDTLQSVDVILYHSPKIMTEISPYKKFKHQLQIKGDLGERMQHAFQESFKRYEHLIIIGADCPLITSSIIEQAFQDLQKLDTVIGPTEDGGYYLLGMKKLHSTLFNNIAWSTSAVFDQTIAKLEEMSLSCSLLKELYDVDYKEDWDRFQNQNS